MATPSGQRRYSALPPHTHTYTRACTQVWGHVYCARILVHSERLQWSVLSLLSVFAERPRYVPRFKKKPAAFVCERVCERMCARVSVYVCVCVSALSVCALCLVHATLANVQLRVRVDI